MCFFCTSCCNCVINLHSIQGQVSLFMLFDPFNMMLNLVCQHWLMIFTPLHLVYFQVCSSMINLARFLFKVSMFSICFRLVLPHEVSFKCFLLFDILGKFEEDLHEFLSACQKQSVKFCISRAMGGDSMMDPLSLFVADSCLFSVSA